jgi:hypothetical protein
MAIQLGVWQVALGLVCAFGVPGLLAAGVLWKMAKHFRLAKECDRLREGCRGETGERLKRGEKFFNNLQQQDALATAVLIDLGYIIAELCGKAQVDCSAFRARIAGLAERAGYQRLK